MNFIRDKKRKRNMGPDFPTTEKMVTWNENKLWPRTEMTRMCREARDIRVLLKYIYIGPCDRCYRLKHEKFY